MVVHGGWGIDGNDSLVNTWRWWGWESKKTIFGKKKFNGIFVNNVNMWGWIEQNKTKKKKG